MSDLNPIIEKLKSLYHNQLFDDVLPFWFSHSIDHKYGGYFTSLNRKGEVFDTDKFIWLQCRQVWTFAKMYNTVRPEQKWLDIATYGADFLEEYGRDLEGSWFFSLNQQGEPLVQPYNIFSDCFAAMAYGQMFQATGLEKYQIIAKKTFSNILRRQNNPKGRYSKVYPGTRSLKSFALPMILCNLVLELEEVLNQELVEATIDAGLHEVMGVFYRPEIMGGVILEHITIEGNFSDTYDGRLFNPGHVLEAMWFVMDLASRRGDQEMIQKAVDISLNTLQLGWDKEFGGLFYFLDVKGHPTQQLEWDQKLWWVHLEAMITALKGFYLTGNTNMWNWFLKLHDYTQNHFPDPEYGEWYGYLNRRGEVVLPLKGGKWKGCFHVPRGLYQIHSILEKINNKER